MFVEKIFPHVQLPVSEVRNINFEFNSKFTLFSESFLRETKLRLFRRDLTPFYQDLLTT